MNEGLKERFRKHGKIMSNFTLMKRTLEPGMESSNPGGQGVEDGELEASLGYIVSPCKNNSNDNKRNREGHKLGLC
jgi:hypothetical protein